MIKEYYYLSQLYASVFVAFLEEFELEVSDLQNKCVVDQSEKNHTVSDLPKLGRARAYGTCFQIFLSIVTPASQRWATLLISLIN